METQKSREDSMNLWEKFRDWIASFFKDLMKDDRALNITAMVNEAAKYKPNDAHGNSYDSVMLVRDQYRRGDMQPDMLEVLKDRFPNTWEKVKKQQVNLKIYKRQIEDGAGAFIAEGEFYLVDDQGNRAGDEITDDKGVKKGVHYEKDAQNFDDLVKDSRLLQSLQAMDEIRGSQHRCIAKPWYDDKKGHVRINTWPPYLYGIIPSGHRWSTS
jgi:hypothetical protein